MIYATTTHPTCFSSYFFQATGSLRLSLGPRQSGSILLLRFTRPPLPGVCSRDSIWGSGQRAPPGRRRGRRRAVGPTWKMDPIGLSRLLCLCGRGNGGVSETGWHSNVPLCRHAWSHQGLTLQAVEPDRRPDNICFARPETSKAQRSGSLQAAALILPRCRRSSFIGTPPAGSGHLHSCHS